MTPMDSVPREPWRAPSVEEVAVIDDAEGGGLGGSGV
jgi:hypothetical protein